MEKGNNAYLCKYCGNSVIGTYEDYQEHIRTGCLKKEIKINIDCKNLRLPADHGLIQRI